MAEANAHFGPLDHTQQDPPDCHPPLKIPPSLPQAPNPLDKLLSDSTPQPGSSVQTEINRAAQQSLNRYPIGASLMRPDLSTVFSTLTVSPPDPHSELLPQTVNQVLVQFRRPLAVVDQSVHQSAPQTSQAAEWVPYSQLFRLGQPDNTWVDRQLRIADRLIGQQQSCLGSQTHPRPRALVFKPIPTNQPQAADRPPTDPSELIPGAVQTASSQTKIALAPSSPDIKSPELVKSFYSQFLNHTLHQQWVQLKSNHEPLPDSSAATLTPIDLIPPAGRLTPKQQSLGPVPHLPFSPVSSSSKKRQDTESPDPLDMNLATRSHSHYSSSAHRNQHHTPVGKRRKPNLNTLKTSRVKRPTSLPDELSQSLPPIETKSAISSAASTPVAVPINSGSFGIPPDIKSKAKRPPKAARSHIHQDPTVLLLSLVDDVLEADDMAISSTDMLCSIQSQLVPCPAVLSALKSLIEQTDGESIARISHEDLARLMKILERGVNIVEELAILPPDLKQKAHIQESFKATHADPRPSHSTVKSLNKKSRPGSHSKINKGCGSNSPDLEIDDDNIQDDYREGSELINKIELRLADLRTCLSSVDTLLTILTRDRYLPKQFYSEELIQSIIVGIKNQFTSMIYPFIQACQRETLDNYYQRLSTILSVSKLTAARIISIFSTIATSILPQIRILVDRIDLSEMILIQVVYIAMGPFFIDTGAASASTSRSLKRKTPFNTDALITSMRLECLKLLRNISSRFPDQRSWIVDEILGSIINLPDEPTRNGKTVYRLPDGKTIQTISALLLHIVQCCLSGSRKQIASIFSTEYDGLKSENPDIEKPPLSAVSACHEDSVELNKSIKACIDPGLTAATKLGKKIVTFLLQKSGKSSKSTHEAHYRAVLDRLVDDLISILYLPEWPVAEFLLSLYSKTMIGLLEGTKISPETNATKSLCLDHLGPITAKLAEPLESEPVDNGATVIVSYPFKSIIHNMDFNAISRLFHAQKSVLAYLEVLSKSNDSVNSALEFVCAKWMLEIIQASTNIHEQSLLGAATSDDHRKKQDRTTFFLQLNLQIKELAVMPSPSGPRPNRHHVEEFSETFKKGTVNETISKIQGLKGMVDVLLDRILVASASSSVTFRSKAIKALGLVVAKDPAIFFKEHVKATLDNRMLDSSPAVRDATIELVGKYVVCRPDLAVAFLPQISARIADKGVSVRRRVVKLLKAIYLLLNNEDMLEIKMEISNRLISRIHDEETSIKILAMNSIDELWFTPPSSQRFQVGATSSIIMHVTASYQEIPSPVEAVMRFISRQNSKKSPESFENFTRCCKDVVQHLIDQLMDVAATARNSAFNEVNCLKAIYILTFSYPKLLTPNRALMLLPYLKGAVTPNEQAMVQYLLKILRACAIEVPRSSSAFGQRLQASLLVLINKPNLNGGGAVLQELVACLCAVVIHQTHDYSTLVEVFKACVNRLTTQMNRLDDAVTEANVKSLPLLMFLVSTLAAYAGFDRLSAAQEKAQEALQRISVAPIHLHVYDILIKIYRAKWSDKIRGVTLKCLGFLFQSYPPLMTRSESTTVMDQVFHNQEEDVEVQHRLLRLIVDFIASQTTQSSDDSEETTGVPINVDIKELIGNVQGFADSGVSSAIVQRYLGHITVLARSVQPQVQKTAVDLISFTIKQGLAHPLECVPVLVALESSPDETLAKRVFGLHVLLHNQRANLVHCRFLETMKNVYEYHLKTAGTDINATGRNPDQSVLGPWYQLLSEKRAWRIDFLKGLMKTFSVDPQSSTLDRKAIGFSQYLAQGLLTLDLRTEEEVLLLLQELDQTISQCAFNTLHLLRKDGNEESTSQVEPNFGQDEDSLEDTPMAATFRASVILGVGYVLKGLLKELYGISDQKLSRLVQVMASKPKIKKSKEVQAVRKMSRRQISERLQEELTRKVPGLQNQLRYCRQALAFAQLVQEDSRDCDDVGADEVRSCHSLGSDEDNEDDRQPD